MTKFLDQVVAALAPKVRVDPSGAKSLAHVCAVVPTAQSGRRLRLALAERFGALVPPCVKTPLDLLLDADDPSLATRTDEIAAFAQALKTADADRVQTLERARQLADIRAILLPKALSFADVARSLAVDFPEEAARWNKLAEDETKFLDALAARGKTDRVAAAKAKAAAGGMPEDGVEEILRFDEFAEPQATPPAAILAASQVAAFATPADEAAWAADYFAAVKPDEAWPALCVADASFFPEIETAFKAKGLKIHNPSETPLVSSSLGRLVRQLVELQRSQSFDVFSAFVRGGDVRRWICGELKMTDADLTAALVDLDNRQAEFLPEKIDDVAPKTEKKLRAIFEFVKVQLRKRTLRSLLGAIFKPRVLDETDPGDREFAAAADVVSTLLTECGDDRDLLALRLDESTYSLEPDAGDEIVTDGWMELPFLDADEVVVVGFQEGCVPESVVGHPFLPDSLRHRLGLPDNAFKEARDRAILKMTVGAREADAVRVSFHAIDAKGDVLKPSRLVFETDDDADLVARVGRFYGTKAGTPEGAAADLPKGWKLKLPIPPPFRELKKISPTRLDGYLRCPFTYYLKDKEILGDKRMDNHVSELQAWEFGNLAHAALESFALSELKDSSDAAAIAAFLAARVDAQLGERFGTAIPAIVWMQGESVKRRLAQFAPVQAARRAAGWRIVAAERKMELEYPFPRPDGSTGVTRFHGKCDRIDFDEATGTWCVIDYKTWDSAEKAQSFEKRRDGTVVWKSLQLPLYCAMLDACGEAPFASARRDRITACYCVLGKTADDVCFTEPFGGGYLPQAEEEVKRLLPLIERGVFWPPSKAEEWKFDFGDWLSPAPEETVDEAWIADQLARRDVV